MNNPSANFNVLSSCEQCKYSAIPSECSCFHKKETNILGLKPLSLTHHQQIEFCNPEMSECTPDQYLPTRHSQHEINSRTYSNLVQLCQNSSIPIHKPFTSSHSVEMYGNTNADRPNLKPISYIQNETGSADISNNIVNNKGTGNHDTDSWFENTLSFIASKCKTDKFRSRSRGKDHDKGRPICKIFDMVSSETELNKTYHIENKYRNSFERTSTKSISSLSPRSNVCHSPRQKSSRSRNVQRKRSRSSSPSIGLKDRHNPLPVKHNSGREVLNETDKSRKSNYEKESLLAKWRLVTLLIKSLS